MILRKICFLGSISILFLTYNIPSFSAQTQHDCDWDCPIPVGSQQHDEPILNKLSNSSSKMTSFSLKKIKKGLIMSRHPELEVYAGSAWLNLGTSQFVPIDGLIGDTFFSSSSAKSHGVVGMALNMDALELENEKIKVQYHFSAFFVPTTTISGNVTQENLVTNLSYSYSVYSISTLFGLKVTSKPFEKNFYLTGDLGLGFNYIYSSEFREHPLVPYAIPDNIFSYGANKVFDFAITTGFGIKMTTVIPRMDFTLGYRFLYLGEGNLPTTNTLVHTSFKTGYGYLNAITGGFIYAFG